MIMKHYEALLLPKNKEQNTILLTSLLGMNESTELIMSETSQTDFYTLKVRI